MDFNTLNQFIGSVGYPIAMSFILCWYIKDVQSKNNEVLSELKSSIDALLLLVKEKLDDKE